MGKKFKLVTGIDGGVGAMTYLTEGNVKPQSDHNVKYIKDRPLIEDEDPEEFTVKSTAPQPDAKPTRERDETTKKFIKSHTMLRFFKYEKGQFSINREELLLLPSARQMIYADKGGHITGDNDGRKKLWCEKQFGLAWWVVDINSPGIQAGLEGEELFDDAYRSLELPIDWKYHTDVLFMAFLEDYGEMYEKAAYARLLKQILMSFNDTAEIVKIIRDNSMKLLKADRDLDAKDISALLAGQKELIAVAGDVPKHIEKLKALQAMVRKEEKEIEIGRGGIEVTSSMDPNN